MSLQLLDGKECSWFTMKVATLLPAAIAAFLFTSCGSDEASKETSQAKAYPLDVCIVSGEKLGSMGAPPSLVHEGQTIKFCCDHCIPDFQEEPAKFLAKLDKPAEPVAPSEPAEEKPAETAN